MDIFCKLPAKKMRYRKCNISNTAYPIFNKELHVMVDDKSLYERLVALDGSRVRSR